MTTRRAWRWRATAIVAISGVIGTVMAMLFDAYASYAGWAPGTDEGMGTDMVAAFIWIGGWIGSAALLFRWWKMAPPDDGKPTLWSSGKATVPPEQWGKDEENP